MRAARVLLCAAATSLAALPAAAGEKVHDSDALNYLLRVPDTWAWGDPSTLAKHGVVELADRVLDVLREQGSPPATGQGARVALSVQDAPATLSSDYETWMRDWKEVEDRLRSTPQPVDEDVKAADALRAKIEGEIVRLAARPDVQALLLSRWPDPKPTATVASDMEQIGAPTGRVPAAKITVEGTCANLKGNDGPCSGRQLVFVIRKKLYRLAFWAWTTPKDREQVRSDLDLIELSFEVPNAAPLGRRPAAPTPAAGGGSEEKEDPELSEVRKVRDLAFGFEVVKPKKFKAREVDRAKNSEANIGFEFRAQSGPSSAYVDLLCYRIGRQGVTAWGGIDSYLTPLWPSFVGSHKEGPLATLPFPGYTDKVGFLVLPDPAKKKAITRPPLAKDGSVEPLTRVEMERVGVVQEVKGAKAGGMKVRETWRFCMQGSLPRVGEELHVHYCFSTGERTFVLRVTLGGKDALDVYRPELTEILKSLKLLDEPK